VRACFGCCLAFPGGMFRVLVHCSFEYDKPRTGGLFVVLAPCEKAAEGRNNRLSKHARTRGQGLHRKAGTEAKGGEPVSRNRS
jgi:hypothetical protein